MTNRKLSSLILVSLAACDSQVDGEHQGQVLATLEGTMQTTQSSTSIAVDVSLAWVVPSGGPSFVGADKVEVEGMLPNAFSLSIYKPPTDDLMSELDGIKFGAAYVVVVPARQDAKNWSAWRGAETDYVLFYLPDAAPAGSEVAALLHGATTAGFHLYAARPNTEADQQARLACWNQLYQTLGREPTLAEEVDTCGGTSAKHELSLATDDLDTPLSIDIVDQFGVAEFNTLPIWQGLL
jgi:hypothetical protein